MTTVHARQLESQQQSTFAGTHPAADLIVRSAFQRQQAFINRSSEHGGAVFDKTGTYRYLLWRNLAGAGVSQSSGSNNTLLLVMLNPNKADETRNDPTIRRCIGFAQSWGFSRLEVVNLFAICAEKPHMLRSFKKPIGTHNDDFILERARSASRVVVAWGAHGSLLGRDADVLSKLKSFGSLECFGVTKDGLPRHPLYVRADVKPLPFGV